VYIPNKESVKKPTGTKSFVQIEINAVFTSFSGKMQFRSGVFDHLNMTMKYCSKRLTLSRVRRVTRWLKG
jgi:hypothetical protein